MGKFVVALLLLILLLVSLVTYRERRTVTFRVVTLDFQEENESGFQLFGRFLSLSAKRRVFDTRATELVKKDLSISGSDLLYQGEFWVAGRTLTIVPQIYRYSVSYGRRVKLLQPLFRPECYEWTKTSGLNPTKEREFWVFYLKLVTAPDVYASPFGDPEEVRQKFLDGK